MSASQISGPGDRNGHDDYFEFEHRRDLGLLIVTLRGFWSPAIGAAFLGALRQENGRAIAIGTPFDILADARRLEVQPQQTAELLKAFLARPLAGSVRRAVLIGKALQGLQIGRVLDRARTPLFDDIERVKGWLDLPADFALP